MVTVALLIVFSCPIVPRPDATPDRRTIEPRWRSALARRRLNLHRGAAAASWRKVQPHLCPPCQVVLAQVGRCVTDPQRDPTRPAARRKSVPPAPSAAV